jgi:hypothetical protein
MKEQSFIQNCDFSFQCPIDWDELENTEDPNRRFCQTCQKQVRYINSNAELDAARSRGYCVAIKLIEPQQPPQRQAIQMGMMSPLPMHKPLPNGRELLEIRDRFLHYLHQGDLKLTIELLTSAQNRFNLDWWETCHEWVLQEVANILETGNSTQRGTVLEVAHLHKSRTNYLEPLVTIMAERGCYEFAIDLANSFQWSTIYPTQKRAIMLAEIASRVAKFGDLERASILILQSWQMSLNDIEVETSEIAAQLMEIAPSLGVAKQSISLTKIANLAAELSLADLAIQIVQSIQSEPERIEAMRSINI